MLLEVGDDDLARVGRGEGRRLAARAAVRIKSQEQALAGDHALAGVEELAHEPLVGRAAVGEARLHLDAVGDVHHGAGFGDHRLARVQHHVHELHVVAVDLVVDLMTTRAGGRPGSGRRRGGAGQRGNRRGSPQLGRLRQRNPVTQSLPKYVRLGIDAACLQLVSDFAGGERTLRGAIHRDVPDSRVAHIPPRRFRSPMVARISFVLTSMLRASGIASSALAIWSSPSARILKPSSTP